MDNEAIPPSFRARPRQTAGQAGHKLAFKEVVSLTIASAERCVGEITF